MITDLGNEYEYITFEGEECVRFWTNGINRIPVLVDKDSWDAYLRLYSWTGGKGAKDRVDAKATIEGGAQWTIYKLIAKREFSELDFWNRTIDHKNNNPLDNRKSNLKPCSPIINSTNISSKYTSADEMYIRKQASGGWKFECYIAKERHYEHFSPKKYGSDDLAYAAAKEYRDNWLEFERPVQIAKAERKCRLIEFERGLRDMLENEEYTEIASILVKYGVSYGFIRQYHKA